MDTPLPSPGVIERPRFIRHPDEDITEHAPVFRRVFTARPDLVSARLILCGLGFHQPCLDGVSISDERCTPPPTNYLIRSYYSEIDLTGRLSPGEHTLTVLVGRGFFAMQTKSVWNYEKSPWKGAPMLFARLTLAYAVGGREEIAADESWQVAHSPIVRSSLYTGEGYDAGHTLAWVVPVEVDDPRFRALKLYPRLTDPIRVLREYRPCEIFSGPGGTQIIKFPVVLAGTAHIRVKGRPGGTLRVRACETLRPDGSPELWQEHVEGEIQTDEYRMDGSGLVDWEPVFDYKSFQYLELAGDIDPVTADDITARQIGSDLEETAAFHCSHPLFNTIYENSLRTVRNNFHGIPTDTPMYEKNGWLGDSGLISEFACTTWRLDGFWRKWLLDIRDCVEESGRIRAIAPSISWGNFDAPEWVDTYFEVVWQLYWQYGLTDPIREHYDTMKRYLAHAETIRDGDGFPRSNLGDWVPPEVGNRGGCVPEGPKISAACYLYKMHSRFATFAALLGQAGDQTASEAAMDSLRTALNDHCLDEETAVYSTGVSDRFIQSDQLLPLAFGIVPEHLRAAVAGNLVRDIRRRFCHLDTGILGTKYILPLLTEAGEADLAFRLADTRTYPGWGYWIENGATTNFETWGLDARSRNHYMFGTIVDWFYGCLAGIRILAPGYAKVRIRPAVCGSLSSCAARVTTPKGPLSVAWEVVDAALFRLKVTVPEGVKGEAVLPDGSAAALRAGYQVLECTHADLGRRPNPQAF